MTDMPLVSAPPLLDAEREVLKAALADGQPGYSPEQLNKVIEWALDTKARRHSTPNDNEIHKALLGLVFKGLIKVSFNPAGIMAFEINELGEETLNHMQMAETVL